MKWLFLWLSAFNCLAQVEYDPARRVPYILNSSYARDEYQWWVANTGQPSLLFYNGIFVSQDTGNADINLLEAWAIQANAVGVKVAVVDSPTEHGSRIVGLVEATAPGATVTLFPVSRYYSAVVAPAIIEAVTAGNQIVVLATGYTEPDTFLREACRYARSQNCILVCSVPDAHVSIDSVLDYPSAFGFPNVLSVTAMDRTGNLASWAAWGSRVIAAPGQSITINGAYSTGTSYAAPIAAGVLALALARLPTLTAADCVKLALESSLPSGQTRIINPLGMLAIDKREYARE